MPRRARAPQPTPVADQVLETPEETVLDVLDHLLNKGVTLTGDVTLGVAGIDLIYLRLSTLLCATDRLFGSDRTKSIRRRSRRRPGIGYRRGGA